ncbi:DUF397 domain-containing protein [Nocardiopsis ansamitocini]|uniref:DUF397 domain-containing protein n=1 Tax=Nocardiopsis ansamitocini TaxID=1670832 RepID=A0A9W6UKF4_9ACTN|nr:DUF397 domain-containing protein [Nocardiopsis ansamitocini]GLU49682.1 hypothetical protein Nans01_40330 [Nocardiopsis ansamitocini]
MDSSAGLTFRKSSYSSTNQDCVEVAGLLNGAAVRDTQNRPLGHIEFGDTEWCALLGAIRTGHL